MAIVRHVLVTSPMPYSGKRIFRSELFVLINSKVASSLPAARAHTDLALPLYSRCTTAPRASSLGCSGLSLAGPLGLPTDTMVRGSAKGYARVTDVTVYFCLFYGTVVGTSDLSALEAAMETALQQAENGSHPAPGLAAQPDAAVAEQPWRPGDCMDYPGEPHALES